MSNKISYLYEFDEFRFDGGTSKLWRDERLLMLSPKASELLKMLLERAGEFVSKEEIFETVWAETFVEDGVLTQNIYTLRKTLGAGKDGAPLIENKTRLGYRITVPVQKTEQSNGSGAHEKLPTPAAFAETPPAVISKATVVEDASQSPPEKSPTKRNKIGVIFAASLILLSVAALFGYLYRHSESETFIKAKFENFRFQRVTDTGDASFPALSPDGNFVAYSKRDDAVYVKDLKTGTESKLNITNVKKFGGMQFSKNSEFLYLKDSASFAQPATVLKVSRFGGEAKIVAENVWSGFSLSPDERQIAFARSFPGENRQSVIIKNLDGATDEREFYTLTAPQEFYLRTYPDWSPDGGKIIFPVNKPNQDFLKFVVADLQTGAAEDLPIANFRQVSQIVWHPKRSVLIAAAREEKNSQLWEIQYPTGRTQRLTNDLSSYLSPRISADGTKLLVTENVLFANLWIFDKETDSLRKQLTFGKSNLDGYRGIAFFSNGEIVYTSNEGDNFDTNLWRINPSGEERRKLTVNAGSVNESPVVSPDDRFVYFSSNRGGKPGIWRIDANGENPVQITAVETASDISPQISPDGGWLYFIRSAGKSAAVWRKSLTNGKEEFLTEEKTFAPTSFLLLSPNGKRLAFQNLSEKAAGAISRPSFQIAVIETENPQRAKFFSLSGRQVGISWARDGKSFYYVLPKKDQDEIWQQKVNENTAPELFRTVSKTTVFSSASSKDGKTFSISGGQLSYDPILITNFE